MVMKFKHHATEEIIEVEPVKSLDNEIVYCKKLDKNFIVDREKGKLANLRGTSYNEYIEDGLL